MSKKINLGAWFQVVEYNLGRELLWLAGMGQRRLDGDSLKVFRDRREGSFYVNPLDDEQYKPLATLRVDEGMWTDALHISTDNPGLTVSRYSDPWCEYVDACEMLSVLQKKLAPEAVIKGSSALGAGRRQQDYMEQYSKTLVDWSNLNSTHKLKFF